MTLTHALFWNAPEVVTDGLSALGCPRSSTQPEGSMVHVGAVLVPSEKGAQRVAFSRIVLAVFRDMGIPGFVRRAGGLE